MVSGDTFYSPKSSLYFPAEYRSPVPSVSCLPLSWGWGFTNCNQCSQKVIQAPLKKRTEFQQLIRLSSSYFPTFIGFPLSFLVHVLAALNYCPFFILQASFLNFQMTLRASSVGPEGNSESSENPALGNWTPVWVTNWARTNWANLDCGY